MKDEKKSKDFHAEGGDTGMAGSVSNNADRHGAKPKANTGNTGMQAEIPGLPKEHGARFKAEYETHQHQSEQSEKDSDKPGIYGEHNAPHPPKPGAASNEPGGLYSEGSEIGQGQRDPSRREENKNVSKLTQKHIENSGGDAAGKNHKR